jgi:hypothetical protein
VNRTGKETHVKDTLLLALVALALGCSNESRPAPASPPSAGEASVCVEIATACHEYEGHSAKAKECHEMGHSKDATEKQCQLRRAECLGECKAAAESAAEQPATEGSSHDHSTSVHKHEH